MAANLRFTASKCPAQEDATCELPFGFLWSPFRDDDDDEDALATTTKEQEQEVLMDLCPTCLAYRNVYCTTTSSSSSQQQQNDEWTCPFCQFTVVGTTTTATGAATPLHPPPPNSTTTTTTVVYRQPVSTAALPAVPTLLLVLDAHLPAAQVQAIGALVESVVVAQQEESKRPLKIGLIVFDAVVSVYQLPTTANGRLASCQEFYNYASTSTSTTDGDVLTDETPYLWTVTPSDDDKTASSSLDPLWTCLQARFGCSRLHNNDNDNDDASSNNNNQKNLSRLEQLKRKKAARLRGTGASSSSPVSTTTTTHAWTTTTTTTSSQQQQRCTADAIHCAAELLVSGDRLWLCTNGCPNRGPGSCVDPDDDSSTSMRIDPHRVTATAIPYFGLLGSSRLLDGVLTDVFLSGNNPLAVPVYQALVEASSGYVLVAAPDTATAAAAEALVHNGRHIYQRTRASLGQYTSSAAHHGGDGAKQPAWIEGCTADIRLSRCVCVCVSVCVCEPERKYPVVHCSLNVLLLLLFCCCCYLFLQLFDRHAFDWTG